MKRIKLWLEAYFTRNQVWRVTYTDGKRTRPLEYSEAKDMKDNFGGKMRIDYTLR